MISYIYDNTFEGLLTAIYEAYYRRQVPEEIVPEEGFQEKLFCQNIYIETDEQKADKVYQSIKKKISPQALQHVFYVFLSEMDGAETWIYQYLKFGWEVGRKIDFYEVDDRVLRIHKISRKVGGECHRLLGLVRFRLLSGEIYYAPIEPDNNIVALLAPHFTKRFAAQNWILHDVKRGIAAVYNKEEWIITELNIDQTLKLEEKELFYQQLWKQYFHSIAIEDRVNPRLQKRCMPMRYWKYLIEKI
ncbi:MAG: TIGR03915 family putative DNA repair protein [Clostridia bacterium]